MDLLCYGKPEEVINLSFYPIKYSGEGEIPFEEWYAAEPLVVYKTDYNKLLIDYLSRVFPAIDPETGETEDHFDVCFGNWLGKNDWNKIITFIKKDIPLIEEEKEKQFYKQFVLWIEQQLEWATIILADGNQ